LQELGGHGNGDHFRCFTGYAGHPNRTGDPIKLSGGDPPRLEPMAKRGPLGFAANEPDKREIVLQANALEEAATMSRSSAWLKLMINTALPAGRCCTAA